MFRRREALNRTVLTRNIPIAGKEDLFTFGLPV
jgi:hypothetical protein